jgi:replication factor C subunit 1
MDKDIRNFFGRKDNNLNSKSTEQKTNIVANNDTKINKQKSVATGKEEKTKKKRKAADLDKIDQEDKMAGKSLDNKNITEKEIAKEDISKKKKTKGKNKKGINENKCDVTIDNPLPPIVELHETSNRKTLNKKIIDDDMDVEPIKKPEEVVANKIDKIISNKTEIKNVTSENKNQITKVETSIKTNSSNQKTLRQKVDPCVFFSSGNKNSVSTNSAKNLTEEESINCRISVNIDKEDKSIYSNKDNSFGDTKLLNNKVEVEKMDIVEKEKSIESGVQIKKEKKDENYDYLIDDLDLESMAQEMFVEPLEEKKSSLNQKSSEKVNSDSIFNNRTVIQSNNNNIHLNNDNNNINNHLNSNGNGKNSELRNIIDEDEKSNLSSSSNYSNKNFNFNFSSTNKSNTYNYNSISTTKNKDEISKTDLQNQSNTTKHKVTKKINSKPKNSSQENTTNQLWTFKYNPHDINSIIGNHSVVQKLKKWLEDWDDVHLRGIKQEVEFSHSTRGKSKIENIYAKACIISGSPGIGKTTAVRVLAKHLGFKKFELNASDQRNKQIIMNKVGYLMDNTTISASNISQRNLIIMDEVDGMAGNEDKGGISALIEIVKKTKVPIICICNDIWNRKLRSLVSHCYDLKFSKPEKPLVLRRLREICEKEKLFMEQLSLDNLYENSGGDIRQCLNFLEMQSRKVRSLNSSEFKESLKKGYKDNNLMLNAFEACKRLLNKNEMKNLSHRARLDLFFIDFDLIPNLIHENYLSAFGNARSLGDIKRLVKCADNISFGDIIDKKIHTNNEWNLLPNKGICSSVAPAYFTNGFIYATKFPEISSKFSKVRKVMRQTKELKTLFPYNSLRTIKDEIVPILFSKIVNLLIDFGKDAIEKVINILHEYKFNLLLFKENLFELVNQKMLAKYEKMNSYIKTHLTKKLNEEFKTSLIKKKQKEKGKYSNI